MRLTRGTVVVPIEPDRRHIYTRAFTMIELMVILAVLTILISILVPSFRTLRESMRSVQCQNNLHQLSNGFLLFATDHDRRLPGGFWDGDLPELDHRDWLLGKTSDYKSGPEGGTVYKYLSGNSAVYRCPSLDAYPPRPGSLFGPFVKSNGRFDYAAVAAFAGASLGKIPGECQMLDLSGTYVDEQTPMIVEEDPIYINGFKLNGAHCSTYTLAHRHRGGSSYATVAGAVVWINEPQTNSSLQGALRWRAQGPSENWISLGDFPYHWGGWNLR